MAEAVKRLGTGTTATTTSYGIGGTTGAQTVYTATAVSVVFSTIAICNKGSTSATYRLSTSSTTAHALNEMIIDGGTVPAYDTVFITAGISMASGFNLLFSASSTNVNCTAYGVEVS